MDTSVLIDFLRGVRSPEALKLLDLLGDDAVIVGDLVLCEVLQGMPTEREARRVEAQLRRAIVVGMVDDLLATEAAAHDRLLRGKGVTIRKTMDLLIATFCLSEDLPLLHRDRDFDAMEQHLGLRVLHA
ncbi:type II toxin-antitoxin system VapC family toxin [Falsiroseomonas bella]|uniref:type II toxin-antitoxin system VapC family toxin n=1 Tax=Falsiroseomonas bella TaxID=2184016 RepID=UPI001E56206B|nr:PIN domain-containing protein [Falsiroseomonas bella]